MIYNFYFSIHFLKEFVRSTDRAGASLESGDEIVCLVDA